MLFVYIPYLMSLRKENRKKNINKIENDVYREYWLLLKFYKAAAQFFVLNVL